jgi:hypothetical protein
MLSLGSQAIDTCGVAGVPEGRPRLSGKERQAAVRIGGPGRDRTDDLFHAMEARSQLRHRPIFGGHFCACVEPLLFSPRLRR